MKHFLALAIFMTSCLLTRADADPFYKGPELFSMRPVETKSVTTIARLGPVGMGIDLIQPAFTMQIHNIEEGSPAAATGKLKAGQIIESINGRKLADIDPRIQLGQIIETAEATDGVLTLKVKDKLDAQSATDVVVNIPVLGAYSKTWPLNCPKSDKIVRNYAEYLKKPGSDKGFSNLGMLFLLSTGDDSDLALVRDWARAFKSEVEIAWYIGYSGLTLCEYYLRTGDPEVVPKIQTLANNAVKLETFGGWAGRGPMAAVTYGGGGGHLNAGGTAVVTFLMLAKECGANIPDAPFNRILAHFYRFAGRGLNPYGNNKPETGYTDNGKNGNLAFAMAAAASLTPDGEKSIYARARDTNARFSFYSTSYMLHGHTGGGIGEIWRSAAMGLLYDKLPDHYREFMDQRKWHYELSRRFDGSFGILGGERYDNVSWGAGYALTYTIPRKTLRLTGAPLSKFAKVFQLPERPWGTKADDDFVSTKFPPLPDGTPLDFSRETLANDASMVLNKKLGGGNADAETVRRYLRHPDYMARALAARSLKNIDPAIFVESLTAPDARVRRAALDGVLHGDGVQVLLTQENFARVIAMLKDPQESWFVKDAALGVIGKAPADWIVEQVDVILPFLKHEEWWLQHSALVALTPVVADNRCYEKVIPAIGQLVRVNQLFNVTSPMRWGKMPENLRNAPPEVQKLASREFKEAYTNFNPMETRSLEPLAKANEKNREVIALTLAGFEGGYDVLYHVAKQRDPKNPLPYQDIFLNADSNKFSPELKQAVGSIVEAKLIPGYIGSARRQLLNEAVSLPPGGVSKMDDLVELYQKSGVADYNWRDIGPSPASMSWSYHTFEPVEKLPWDSEKPRYRKVTMPVGTEEWYSTKFDPDKSGWKTGRQPFGQNNGKPGGGRSGCKLDFCRCGEPVQTFWENEVLLARGAFKFPAFREGYRYRLLVGGMSHVGGGDGFRVYVNGKQFVENVRPVERRAGARPIGGVIEKPFWTEFRGGDVGIASIAFKNGHKGFSNNHYSIWIQEMKVPPLGEKEILNSVTVTPMLSSEWQEKQDPDNAELQSDDDRFHYDGKFIANPKVAGKWTTIATVPEIDAFNPAKPVNANRGLIKAIDFKDGGRTDQMMWLWSGDILMDLERNQALKMIRKTINNTDYLFIEAGGFSTRNKPGWKVSFMVLKRS